MPINSISIIIPSTRKKSLYYLIKKLYPQLHYDDEIIIIYDPCIIDTVALKRNFPHLVLIKEKEFSPAHGRNKGIVRSKNKFLLFLDDDVIPVNSLLKEYRKKINENPDLFGIAGGILPICKNNIMKAYYKAQKYSWKHDKSNGIYVTCNLLLRNEGIQFDERFSFSHEDVGLSTMLKDKKILITDKCCVYHQMPSTIIEFMKKFFLYGEGRANYLRFGYTIEKKRKKQIQLLISIRYFLMKFPFEKGIIFCILEMLKYSAYYLGFFNEKRKNGVKRTLKKF